MENQNLDIKYQERPAQTTYPDPTKPVGDQSIHRHHLSKGWIFFIGFNILFPIVFLATYLFILR